MWWDIIPPPTPPAYTSPTASALSPRSPAVIILTPSQPRVHFQPNPLHPSNENSGTRGDVALPTSLSSPKREDKLEACLHRMRTRSREGGHYPTLSIVKRSDMRWWSVSYFTTSACCIRESIHAAIPAFSAQSNRVVFVLLRWMGDLDAMTRHR